ncbi:capsular polysaccharide biosynthesis protein CapF [Vagococcus zengguangii]|uniref:capsular polysaccharide biosynthesis protein CapF n=1 Tax=Vagococcus zengguangii TaxID=2571750 RepID=UPI0011080CC9|nr:capsular polysaccharide biosynthesis protein CapF [Vagococcus zengguangii]TLG80944.1 capsular polysaccharide biosynthesis protein CapF [Vagococcus zengguangii]
MKILITGAKGFVGKNLVSELQNRNYQELLLVDRDTPVDLVNEYVLEADFIFHLAGINRPTDISEFKKGNTDFTGQLINLLVENKKTTPFMVSSSTQAELDNDYGKSKREGEDFVRAYGEKMGAKTFIYRFPNIFGKWSQPNYNSAIATFCYNTARDLPITVNDSEVMMNLVYIDDVVNELISALEGKECRDGEFCYVTTVHKQKLGWIVETIKSFKESRTNIEIPNMGDELTKKLYSTYLSFLPEDDFSYNLKMNVDNRGSFTEFIRTENAGQVSINISKPGIVKGNHWHHTKNEKFLVVSGTGVIRFRKVDSEEILEYFVNGDKLEVVDIPVGYTHNIENLGQDDMVTVMWVNEPFNPDQPDTFFVEV